MGLFSGFLTGPRKDAPHVPNPNKKYQDGTRQYRYSFSGADARAFVYFEGMEDTVKQLEALHTISVSVHEGKGQARALGFRGVKGLARGVRTIAGSMILTVIEDNPLRPLMENLQEFVARGNTAWPGWSIDRHEIGTGSAMGGTLHFANRIAPLLPPTNILLEYVSEGALYSPRGAVNWVPPEDGFSDRFVSTLADKSRKVDVEGASMLLRGVEFIDEGVVTSANDIVTEITLSFIATDFKPISAQVFGAGGIPFLPVNEDQRRDWEMRQKLFKTQQTTRVIEQNNALSDVVQRNRTED